jgi:hypothetical protein
MLSLSITFPPDCAERTNLLSQTSLKTLIELSKKCRWPLVISVLDPPEQICDHCNRTLKLSHNYSLRYMCSIQYSRVEFFGGGRELLGSPNLLSIRPREGG